MTENTPRGHQSFEHTADLGLFAWGDSLAALLEEVGVGLAEIIADINTISARESRPLSVEGEDREELLVSLANEILFYVDAESFLTREVRLSFVGEKDGLLVAQGEIRGEPYDASRHTTFTEIKSATYHDLAIQEENGRFSTRIVFDV